jgi:glycosyltransferase involved in cell wall biosynthesis
VRLLFATSIKTWGGGEEWMLSAARGLAERGHDVRLVARPGSAVIDSFGEAGLPVHEAAFASDADVGSFLAVHRLSRRHRIEAMILNMDRVLRVGGTAARWAGVSVVLPRRGSEFPLKDGPLYRFTYRRIATGMIVNSRATERTLTRDIAWRPAGTVHVLPNGVDLARFRNPRPRADVRREIGVPEDALLVLGIGELTERKNFGLVVSRLPGWVAAGHDVHVAVAGEGDRLAAWQRLSEEGGVAERVHWLGFRRDVPDLLGAADLLVHPARVEGFGYAVAEAMAAGLPVVAADASSLPELVDAGRTGLLFPPDDGEALDAAVLPYLESPERRKADGERGRARAEAEFSLERRGAELERILLAELARDADR